MTRINGSPQGLWSDPVDYSIGSTRAILDESSKLDDLGILYIYRDSVTFLFTRSFVLNFKLLPVYFLDTEYNIYTRLV